MSWWSDKTHRLYRRMTNHHPMLWPWIKEFIAEHEVKSILDVGAGMDSQAKPLAQTYQAVDLNEQVDAIHADFTTMDVSPLVGKYDLLLAAAVIEHCDGYEEFIKQALKVGATYTLITFFNRLDRKVDVKSHRTAYGGEYWWNKYSRENIIKFLHAQGVQDFRFVKLSRIDEILIIYKND